ncbi:MAG: C40 family peptidase [Agathobacter sp.]|nr:C40 family peptidase [Agathobacter sp.]
MKTIKKFLSKYNNLIIGLLVFSLLIAIPYVSEQFWASSAQDIKEEAEENLEDIENEIDEMEEEQENIEAEIGQAELDLSDLIDKQNELKVEIDETQASIEQTQIDLEIARAEADAQYEAMKIRIQYMYENSTGDNVWAALLEADGITDFLNRLEYITTLHNADRELTDEYEATVAAVEEQERLLMVQMDELLVKQETFLGQQADIEAMIASLEDERDQYADALAEAEALAEEYRETIEEQSEIIRKEEEEKREEEEDEDDPYIYEGDATGQDVVNYAMQFVGNPYVWGGNSLTNGCDCSGFVHLVYKHFGITTVRYSMSFLYEGVPVSREEVQPGDIVVYAIRNGVGHVAIYAGDGKIVEAQSSAAGITANRSIDCREIVGIRRIIQ